GAAPPGQPRAATFAHAAHASRHPEPRDAPLAWMPMNLPLSLIAVAACAACSQQPASPAPEPTATAASPAPTAATPASATPPAVPSANTLTLAGLGGLRIGEPVPAGGTWAERGAQASDTCRTVSSPDYPGVYAIVEDGRVRRISAGQRSAVALAEGIGAGAG